jgi:hypothetical protein
MFKSRSGTPGTYSIVSSGDTLGTLRWSGDDGVSQVTGAEITASVDGTPGTNDMPGRLTFSTTADGSATPTERMRIDNQGNFGFNFPTSGGGSGQYRFSGNITGDTTSPGIFYTPTIQSDVTNTTRMFHSSPSTQDAAFTLGNLYHFSALQGTITGGSRIAPTNQAGFFIDNSLIGATNNYGFQGTIPAGTGRWNLYMNGSADNYIAGNVGIGIITPTQRLDVVGNANVSGTINSGNLAVTGSIQTANITTGANTTPGAMTGNWQLTAGSKFQTLSADIGERYTADGDYPAGTVLMIGGTKETTIATFDGRYNLAGVVSTEPAYILNSDLEDSVVVALIGRIPCLVTGNISKGDMLTISNIDGVATASIDREWGTIIGRALESYNSSNVGTIEIKVDRA